MLENVDDKVAAPAMGGPEGIGVRSLCKVPPKAPTNRSMIGQREEFFASRPRPLNALGR